MAGNGLTRSYYTTFWFHISVTIASHTISEVVFRSRVRTRLLSSSLVITVWLRMRVEIQRPLWHAHVWEKPELGTVTAFLHTLVFVRGIIIKINSLNTDVDYSSISVFFCTCGISFLSEKTFTSHHTIQNHTTHHTTLYNITPHITSHHTM